MTLPDQLSLLMEPLAALQRLLDRFHQQGVIMGGIASALLGKPRFTVDLDAMFLASNKDIPGILKFAEVEGIAPRLENAEEFARKNRVLLLRHSASGVDIDISLGVLPFEEEVVERSKVYQVGRLHIRLPAPEDLIILKVVAHRPKDLFDIQAIAESNPNLDLEHIERWVKDFASVLEMPELWEEIKQIITSAN
ncbi:MAG: nucleotidyl transferase AbiEii/AbiGii toxin family protein [Nitrospirota bacterium]